MVELQQPEGYNPNWKRWSLDSLPMLPEHFELQARGDESGQKQLHAIVDLFQKAALIICATDAGREGELIFRYILQWAQCEDKPVKRLWISSLTDQSIQEGFRQLRDGREMEALARAARCRSEADWIVGLNGTRFFTVKYARQRELWTVGRVQTPVLAMIVARDLDIENFKPQDFWDLYTQYRDVRFKYDGERMYDQEKAQALLEKIRTPKLVINDIQKVSRSFQPPFLYDLTSLQQEMNKRFGMTADRTLKTAQTLYERKHITYPRTDSRFLSSDMKTKLPGLVETLRRLLPEEIGVLDLKNLKITKRMVDDSKISDHHAIIPTDQLPGKLQGDEARLYEAVVRRFVAGFFPPCMKDLTTVRATVVDAPFLAKGAVVTNPGWQQLYPHMLERKKKSDSEDGNEDDAVLPLFEKGESGPHEPGIRPGKTKPPPSYTEASLLQMMETAGKQVDDEALREAMKEKGLGTPATRASIIETLLHRNYIQRRRKNLISTQAGRDLIAMIQDERLKSPELTGEWEFHLKQIEQGRYDATTFMQQVIDHTRQILSQSGSVERGQEWLGPCPQCDGHIIEGKKGYGCSRWKAGCTYVLWKEQPWGRLQTEQVRQLLQNRKTEEPIWMEEGGKKSAAFLCLGTAGEPETKRPAGLFKISGRNIVGICPKCGSDVIEGEKAFGCSAWKSGCDFKVWRTMSGKRIPVKTVEFLLKNGITPLIKKFKRKDGKLFDARLKIVEGIVESDYISE